MGYLSQVKSGGKQYIYLTEYCVKDEFSTKHERHVFSFGNSSVALLKMKRWLHFFESEFPNELLDRGYDKKDLKTWIKTLETGVTQTGKKFNFKEENRVAFKYINIY